jgi:hypothetical protein
MIIFLLRVSAEIEADLKEAIKNTFLTKSFLRYRLKRLLHQGRETL